MNNINNEILSAIDSIETATMEAEMNVMESLIDAYNKSVIILENYEGEDIDSFDVFQEGFKDAISADKGILGDKSENIFMRILMVIPRLIASFIRFLGKTFSKKDKAVIDGLKNVSNMSAEQKQNAPEGPIDVKRNVIVTKIKIEDVVSVYENISGIFDKLNEFDMHKPSSLSKDTRQNMKDVMSGDYQQGKYEYDPDDMVDHLIRCSESKKDIIKKGEALINKFQSMYDEYKKVVTSKSGNENSIKKNQKEKLDNVTQLMNDIKLLMKRASDIEKSSGQFTDEIFDQLVAMGVLAHKE